MLGLYTAPLSAGGVLLLNATPYTDSATYSTNDHGFEALPATVRRRLTDIFRLYDTSLLYVGLVENGAVFWEGRLEDPAIAAGTPGSGLHMQALGAWRTLMDDRYTALWSTTSVADWRPATTDQLTNAGPERYQIDTNNRLFIAPQKNATYANAGANFMIGGVVFDLPDDATRNAATGGIQFDYETNTPANWLTRLQTFNSAGALIATPWSLASTGALATGSIYLNALAGNPARCIFEVLYNAAAAVYAGETGAAYLKITNVRITTTRTHEVNTTWSAPAGPVTGVQTVTPASMVGIYVGQRLFVRQGAATNAESVVVTAMSATTFTAAFVKNQGAGVAIQALQVYADDIVKDIVSQISTLNSTQLSSSAALIQSPGLDLTDEIYEDAVPTDILMHLAELGDNQATPRQWEVGVWEGRVLHFRPRGSAGRAWYVDVTSLEIARTLEDLVNSVYARYQDAQGRALRTAVNTDSASVARYGLTRRASLSTDTTSSTQAAVQRDAQLADHKDPLPRATVSFEAVYSADGARWPLYLVRSGDTVTIRNLPPSISTSIDRVRTFRISHTLYNLNDRTLEIELEVPPPRLVTLLARRAEGIRTSFGRS